MLKVFIDGREGTTGLRLAQRLSQRDDLTLLALDDGLRKDINARREMLNAADFAFLCLPDQAAREAVTLIENPSVKVIDASTAHRTEEGWAYGFPELGENYRQSIISGGRVAVPGCHASGAIALIMPLIESGLAAPDYPFAITSVTGYSGGGKRMIAEYETAKSEGMESPRQYALEQEHKHLKEIVYHLKLVYKPLFMPYVADYYSGMQVSVPIRSDLLTKKTSVKRIKDLYREYYFGSSLIKLADLREKLLPSNEMSGSDAMLIRVAGNDERPVLIASYDNLGKGASGAAVECFNLMSGAEECKGLKI